MQGAALRQQVNLVCAPQKAVSFLIAAETFRRLPRLEDYGRYPASTRFGPFRVSHEEDLSEMATARDFLHSNTTRTDPPSPDALERIVGCGSSPLVRYEGTGAYFLEKLTPGAWRLEVYPDAVWVNDPYGAHRLDREVARIFWREWPMEIRLRDLGKDFSIEPLNEGNCHSARAKEGTFPIRPGVFLLKHSDVTSDDWKTAKLVARVGLREFGALPGKDSPAVAHHEPLANWVEAKALPLQFTLATPTEPEEVVLEIRSSGETTSRRLPLQRQCAYKFSATVPADWMKPGSIAYSLSVGIGGALLRFPANEPSAKSNSVWTTTISARTAPLRLFGAERHNIQQHGDFVWKKSLVPGMAPDQRALRIAVDTFGSPPDSISFRNELSDELEPWREIMRLPRVLWEGCDPL
jgi:hypothetical protein